MESDAKRSRVSVVGNASQDQKEMNLNVEWKCVEVHGSDEGASDLVALDDTSLAFLTEFNAHVDFETRQFKDVVDVQSRVPELFIQIFDKQVL